ncbi:hypothetical protein PR048_028554 [Dryococelus australis]|uniref:Transposase n=1 Tax=Dryococelus australis TaxID=614101 RepID=A0ABQ9GDN3_9NEOP|nr:hypothetical protein PR048_028554 [Dryococelus australis]
MDIILMNESNTSQNISAALCQALEDWGIPVQDSAIPLYCVTDNGANFISAATRSFTPVQCFAHTLQNAITEVKKKTAGVATLLTMAEHYS